MGTQGPNFPASVTNNAAVGNRAWVNPQNAQNDNPSNPTGIFTSPLASMGFGTQTNYLDAEQFGFTVPEETENVTVTFTVRKRRNGGMRELVDSAVRLIDSGVIGATEYALASNWPHDWDTTDYVVSGLTASQVNANNFGFAMSVAPSGGPDSGRVLLLASPAVDVISAVASW